MIRFTRLLAMFAALGVAALAMGLLGAPVQAQTPRPEPAGSRDHPLVGRYENSTIRAYVQSAYQEGRIITGPVPQRKVIDDSNSVAVAGRQTIIVYQGPQGRSALEIVRNYQQKLMSGGFEQLFECHRETCGDRSGTNLWFALVDRRPLASFVKPGWDTGRYVALRQKRAEGDVHVALYVQEVAQRTEIRVEVVEAKGLEGNRIKVVGASELEQALESTGKVALYGIFFDTDKAEVKPDSKAQIDAIIAFLRANPAVNIIVAGHTDNQGTFDYNVDLSRRRAQAVGSLLSAGGIAQGRLTAFGAGMSSPVAANADEAGRARNRRVEIVRR